MTAPLLNFFGNLNSKFNQEIVEILKASLKDREINLVSLIDFSEDFNISMIEKLKEPIILIPIEDNKNYFDNISIAWKLMISSAFYDYMNSFTNILIVMPGEIGTSPTDISKIILDLDTESLVDNLWVWPDHVENKVFRDNVIENLPFQRAITS